MNQALWARLQSKVAVQLPPKLAGEEVTEATPTLNGRDELGLVAVDSDAVSFRLQ